MQIGQCHVVVFERARKQPVEPGSLCGRYKIRESNCSRLRGTAFCPHVLSQLLGGVLGTRREAAAERIEQVLCGDVVDVGRK